MVFHRTDFDLVGNHDFKSQSLVEFGVDSMDPTNVLAAGRAPIYAGRSLGGMGSFCAGDIVVTRWMWKRCIDMNVMHAPILSVSSVLC